MTIKVREWLPANPFVPFDVRRADSRLIPVPHPDFASSFQTGHILHVFHRPQSASTFVDVVLVTALELSAGSAPISPAA